MIFFYNYFRFLQFSSKKLYNPIHTYKIFSYRNIENKLGYQSFHSKHVHKMEFTMFVFLVCLITAFGVYFCLRYCKFFRKSSKDTYNVTDNDFDPHILVINKLQDKKMIRSRSGTFNNSAFSEV